MTRAEEKMFKKMQEDLKKAEQKLKDEIKTRTKLEDAQLKAEKEKKAEAKIQPISKKDAKEAKDTVKSVSRTIELNDKTAARLVEIDAEVKKIIQEYQNVVNQVNGKKSIIVSTVLDIEGIEMKENERYTVSQDGKVIVIQKE